MNTEFEAKFVDIDHDKIRAKLKELGATLVHPMRLMRRAIIENDALKKNNGFIRVRDEGDRTTLTYKQFNNLSIDGAKESEVIVSDFQNTLKILESAGLYYNSLQESRRETWLFEDAEIVLDEWPWLNPYIEIEANSEDDVKHATNKLGLDWNEAIFGDVMAAYRKQYPHLTEKDTIAYIQNVQFKDPLPDLLKNQND